MSIIEAFRIALTALLTNKVRALLTMLGIIMGVGAVIGMLAIGNGLTSYIQSEYDKLGVGVFYIQPFIESKESDSAQKPRLTAEDATAILRPGAAPAVKAVAIEYNGNGVVSAGKDRYSYSVKGITPSGFSISSNSTLVAGRYYTPQEEDDLARVAVLGRGVAETLFGNLQNAIARRMTINGISFDVIGVTDTKASQVSGSFNSPNDIVYIPYQTARNRLFRNQLSTRVDVSQVTVQALSINEVNTAIDQVTKLLRIQHRLTFQPNDFTITNPAQQAEQAKTSIIGLNAFLGIIAGISLLVGGIGIMNIMLVSVAQRTREIGLRKAVGARRWDILQQFLIEAIVLCLVGCALGVTLGYMLSFAGTYVLQNIFRAEDSRATVTLGSILLATVVSTGIGLIFGFFPALHAARLHPIEALRTE